MGVVVMVVVTVRVEMRQISADVGDETGLVSNKYSMRLKNG